MFSSNAVKCTLRTLASDCTVWYLRRNILPDRSMIAASLEGYVIIVMTGTGRTKLLEIHVNNDLSQLINYS